MRVRFPLYAKILCWFFLNVLFLGVIFALLARGQFHFALDALVSGPAGGRLQAAVELLTGDLRDRPRSEWSGVLQHFNEAYRVQSYLFQNGNEIAGAPVELPPVVRARMEERHMPNRPRPGQEPPPFLQNSQDSPPRDFSQGPDEHHHPMPPENPPPRAMVHTSSPSRYWVIMPLLLPGSEPPQHPGMAALVVESAKLSGGGLFFDLTGWVIAGIGVVLISALFWFPPVRGITRAISRMTRATEQIAEGRFDVRSRVTRRDELGSLSEAINRMAARLSGFVAGQKRFLGDIAHELCSPIARIQVALGILEQRADEKQKVYLADLREEVEEMSKLVDELLMFSKASLGGANIRLQPMALRVIVEKAVARERGLGGGVEVKTNVPEDSRVMAEPELLLRAIGNILRNAIRYAGQAGPITISAARAGANVELSIEDSGPGIPDTAIEQVFDPFYRVDASRARETGGVGLGLSIVKTCVESCGGTVRCENRQPHGLRVVVRLTAAGEGN